MWYKKLYKRTWTVYSPPWPAESTSKLENFSNICKLTTQMKCHYLTYSICAKKSLTFPVLFILCVTFNSASESLGSKFGIEPPVACLKCFQDALKNWKKKKKKKRDLPATQHTRKITIRQLPLQRLRPIFLTTTTTPINHSPIGRVDISSWTSHRRIYKIWSTTANRLTWKLGFIKTELTRWNQSKSWLVWRWWWDWSRCYVCW